MNTEKIVKETKIIMVAAFMLGSVLLAIGIVFSLAEVNFFPNNKAIIGLSFIPLSISLIYYVKWSRIKKSPHKMRSIIVTDMDERLVALKNEAQAKAFKILQGTLFLTYMGYTLMVPEDIFETVGWWILLILLFTSFITQAVLLNLTLGKRNCEQNDEDN